MRKISFKSLVASLFFLVLLTSFSYAGEGHCPVVPPPPPPDEGGRGADVITDRYQFDEIIKGVWEFLALN